MGAETQVTASTAGAPSSTEPHLDFLAAHGGPFFDLQRRMNLLHESSLKSGRRAVLFVAIAWGVPLVLTLPTVFSETPTVWRYLSDPGPWTRFFLGIAAFVLAEQHVETGLKLKLEQFARAPLIAPASMEAVAAHVARALRQRDSGTAELVCLLLAVVAALFAYANFNQAAISTWSATVSPESSRLTAAGWWGVFVSIPMFVFLFLRGCWRHLVWANMLRRIARLELRLVATHPDGKGGLSFLAEYPNAYVLFVFGVSTGTELGSKCHKVGDHV